MDQYNTIWHTGEEHELKTAIDRIVRDLRVGLISMRERVNLVGGELLVESQPSRGTQIKACVPLNPSTRPD